MKGILALVFLLPIFSFSQSYNDTVKYSVERNNPNLSDSLGNEQSVYSGEWDYNISSYFKQSVLRVGLSVSVVMI
jgi:hypothetical protein